MKLSGFLALLASEGGSGTRGSWMKRYKRFGSVLAAQTVLAETPSLAALLSASYGDPGRTFTAVAPDLVRGLSLQTTNWVPD